jgi:hypothetical protein
MSAVNEAVAYLDMRVTLALIEHENIIADRELSKGDWLYDHTSAISDLLGQYERQRAQLNCQPQFPKSP